MRLIHHTITYGALVLAALCTPGCSNDGEELSTAKMLLAQGTDQSEQAACQIFFKLAEDGDADAQFHLALCLRNGWGVQRTVESMAAATEWARLAAEAGHSKAQTYLGVLILGNGPKRQQGEAADWLRRAAEQGEPEAMLLLAESYEKGLGVPKDSKVWRSWLLRAVEQGDARIQFLAGESFERVAATPADLAEAARCYSLAAEQGQRDAINALKRLKQQEQ